MEGVRPVAKPGVLLESSEVVVKDPSHSDKKVSEVYKRKRSEPALVEERPGRAIKDPKPLRGRVAFVIHEDEESDVAFVENPFIEIAENKIADVEHEYDALVSEYKACYLDVMLLGISPKDLLKEIRDKFQKVYRESEDSFFEAADDDVPEDEEAIEAEEAQLSEAISRLRSYHDQQRRIVTSALSDMIQKRLVQDDCGLRNDRDQIIRYKVANEESVERKEHWFRVFTHRVRYIKDYQKELTSAAQVLAL